MCHKIHVSGRQWYHSTFRLWSKTAPTGQRLKHTLGNGANFEELRQNRHVQKVWKRDYTGKEKKNKSCVKIFF